MNCPNTEGLARKAQEDYDHDVKLQALEEDARREYGGYVGDVIKILEIAATLNDMLSKLQKETATFDNIFDGIEVSELAELEECDVADLYETSYSENKREF